jgi:hypothetical protein
MNTAKVEKVNLATLPAAEMKAIQAAEAEAEAFYQGIEDEEAERFRLAELKAVCGLMWNNRYIAVDLATESLNGNNVFTDTEKATILRVAASLHPEAPYAKAIKALNFITSTSSLYKTMKNGYYFDNLPATELLAGYKG